MSGRHGRGRRLEGARGEPSFRSHAPLSLQVLSCSRELPCVWRALHTSAVCAKVSAAWRPGVWAPAASECGTCGRGCDLGHALGRWSRKVTGPLSFQNRAARVRVGKGDKPVTYEQAHAPHHIAHRKGWLSLHTGEGTMPVAVAGEDEDVLWARPLAPGKAFSVATVCHINTT